jgi:hypothetical protein
VFVPRKGASPRSVRKLKAIFGKMIIRYGRLRFYTEFHGSRDETEYEVLGSDSKSVVIRFYSTLWLEEQIVQIHFEGEHYWVWAHGIQEYFKKVVKK